PVALCTSSLRDALPICRLLAELRRGHRLRRQRSAALAHVAGLDRLAAVALAAAVPDDPPLPDLRAETVRRLCGAADAYGARTARSEEHTSELQSRENLV